MVVLSAAVQTRSGKTLLARQYVPMTRVRIEGLLAAFPKLVSGESEHTFIDTENVRYIYQPMEELYIVLVTNKQSNIKEDLDTLRMIAKLIPEYCNGHDPASVQANAFHLIFAIDEAISIGYKEYVSIEQIQTFTEMESQEERRQELIRDSKESETRTQREMISKRLEQTRTQRKSMPSASSSSLPRQTVFEDTFVQPQREQIRTVSNKRTDTGKKGMVLKSKATQDDSLFAELGGSKSLQPVFPSDINANAESRIPVSVRVEERVSIALDRDSVLKKLDVRGELLLGISDPDCADVVVSLEMNDALPFKFNVNPRVDKAGWKRHIIQSRGGKGFPIGKDNALSVLRWRHTSEDEDLLPVSVNIWPTEENGMSVVMMEYTKNNDAISLLQLSVCIPCPTRPDVSQENNNFSYDPAERLLTWYIDDVKDTETFEFSIDAVSSDAFFPAYVSFESRELYSGISVPAVSNSNGDAVEYATESSMIVNEYIIS